MNIGWLRIGNPIDLDYMNSSVFSLNTGIRLGCMEALVQNGHKVTIVSYVKPDHRKLLDDPSSGQVYDYSWMKGNVVYDVSVDPDKLDWVMLEYGPGTTLFSHTPDDPKFMRWIKKDMGFDKNVSYWSYLKYLLARCEDKRLVYFTANGNKQLFMRCPLLANQMDDRDYVVRGGDDIADSNIRNIMKGINYSHYKWECVSNALDTKRLYELHKGSPSGRLFSGWYSIPVGYSDNFDPIMNPRPLEKTKVDFMYVGHQRDENRTRKLMKFFGPTSYEYKIHVWGNWKTDEFDPCRVVFNGPTKNQGVTPDLYNTSVATVFVGESQFETLGTMTPRIMISSRAGCVVFADADVWLADHMVGGTEFMVRDADDLMDKYERVITSNKKRLELLEKQRAGFKPWSKLLDKVIRGNPDLTTSSDWKMF